MARRKYPALAPFTRDVGKVTGRHLTPARVRGSIANTLHWQTALTTGWVGNGAFAYRASRMERAAFNGPAGGETHPILSIVDAACRRCDGPAAVVLGAREGVEQDCPLYHLSDAHGRQAIVNATYYLTIMNRHSEASVHLDPDPSKPCVFWSESAEHAVGLLCPIDIIGPATVVPYEGEA